jgi:hypothetical protein
LAYLYICSDTKHIYFGTSDKATATKLVTSTESATSATKLVSADGKTVVTTDTILSLGGGLDSADGNLVTLANEVSNIKNGTTKVPKAGSADKATKLATGRTLGVSLEKDTTPTFDGSANVTMGVSGTLPINNGGTGATTAADACTNLITDQTIYPNAIKVGKDKWAYDFYGTGNTYYGLDMNNSDIINANSIVFSDMADGRDEGIYFSADWQTPSVNYDKIHAEQGNMYFTPGKPLNINPASKSEGRYMVYHQGNVYIRTEAEGKPTSTAANPIPEGAICILY